MTHTDFRLFTDGSGHVDGFGGWAALVQSTDGRYRDFRMGAMTGTSVDRMEMTALIEGLHLTLQMAKKHPDTRRFLDARPTVLWFSDRESIVKSALGEYARSNATDLWGQFAWFESQLTIYPIFVSRENEHPEFATVDLHSSTARVIIKNYFESVEDSYLLQQEGLPRISRADQDPR